jgi:hypothetical protein
MMLKPSRNLTPWFWGPSDPTYYPGIDDARERERDRKEQYAAVYQWFLDRGFDPRKKIERDAFVRAYTEAFMCPPPFDEQQQAAEEVLVELAAEEAPTSPVLLVEPQTPRPRKIGSLEQAKPIAAAYIAAAKKARRPPTQSGCVKAATDDGYHGGRGFLRTAFNTLIGEPVKPGPPRKLPK